MNLTGKQELLIHDVGVRERGNFGLRTWNHRVALVIWGSGRETSLGRYGIVVILRFGSHVLATGWLRVGM